MGKTRTILVDPFRGRQSFPPGSESLEFPSSGDSKVIDFLLFRKNNTLPYH